MNTLTLLAALLAICSAHPDPSSQNKISEKPVVTTPLGQIQGSVIQSRLGRQIYSFRGIRYAKAPINELRFKPPVPVDKYEGIYNATEDGPLCPQPTNDPVSEDCLLLNVYSTRLPKNTDKVVKRPVIIYIHGGGFSSKGAASYWLGPNYFLDQDIVLVTIQYRLGALGFLSTGDKEAPGNNGLRDQVQAFKWVKQNIEAFGGDPNSVTLMGYHAGAMSIILHLVSPLSNGLFNKAIAMSGSATAQWPIPHNQLDLAKKLAYLVGCPNDTAANIIKCLKTKPYNEIAETLPQFAEFAHDPLIIWRPVIENDFGQPRFLTAHPVHLIQTGQFKRVPFLTGVTNDEYAYKAFAIVNNETLLKDLNENWEKNAPIAFMYERETEHSKIISKALREYYFQNKPVDKTNVAILGQMYADSGVGFGVNRAAKMISEASNQSVYYYKFAYQGRFSHFYTPESNMTQPYGVVHHDDLIYLFYIQKLFPPFKEHTPTEIEMVNKYTSLMANFAKFGNPIPTPNDKLDNIKWEPYNTKTYKYLDIGNKLTVQEKMYEKRYMEWEKLFPIGQYMKNKQSG